MFLVALAKTKEKEDGISFIFRRQQGFFFGRRSEKTELTWRVHCRECIWTGDYGQSPSGLRSLAKLLLWNLLSWDFCFSLFSPFCDNPLFYCNGRMYQFVICFIIHLTGLRRERGGLCKEIFALQDTFIIFFNAFQIVSLPSFWSRPRFFCDLGSAIPEA